MVKKQKLGVFFMNVCHTLWGELCDDTKNGHVVVVISRQFGHVTCPM